MCVPLPSQTPMHGKDQLQVDDDRVPVRSGKRMAFEYDGLEAGELAWIMSKTFKPPTAPVGAPHISLAEALQYHSLVSSHTVDLQAPIPMTTATDRLDKGGDGSLMNQEGVLNGFGVDRMQRLAYTNWVEAYYRQRLGRQWIDMCAADLGDPMFRALDSTLDDFRLLISGASLFAVPDLTHALEYLPPDATLSVGTGGVRNYVGQTMQPLPQGLFILERGPFLRSMGASTEVSTIRVPFADPENVPAATGVVADMSAAAAGYSKVTFSMSADRTAPRHLGGELAQRGLYALLKQHGVFNWTPDGIVLSKLETGPSPDADAYLDAKQGQMFNVSIQGPAITKTWTGDPRMACQPMDKVFVLVVGDIDYKLADANGRANQAEDDDRVSDEATMLLCKRISKSLRTIMRTPTGGALDAFPQMSMAQNTSFYGTNAASVDVANALTFDTNPSPNNKIFQAFGTPNSGQRDADTLRDSLAQLRNVAKQRRANKSEAAKSSPMRELWIQVTNRATFYEMALRQSGNNARDLNVQRWYDNNQTRADNRNRNNNEVTRDGHRGLKQLLADLNEMLSGFDDTKTPTARRSGAFSEQFETKQKAVLNGTSTVAVATLCNLRLKRCTSSYLAQYSHPEKSNPHSRLGLNITYNNAGQGSGLTSFVLGGWCVGTVLDSAASRSMQGPMVRVAPQSMAMNVNVNIEWWSADKLHQHYGDPASWDLGPVAGGFGTSKRLPSVRSRVDPRHGEDMRREGQDAGLNPSLAVGLAVSSAQALPAPGTKKFRYIHAADDIAPDSDVGRENAVTAAGGPAGFATTP